MLLCEPTRPVHAILTFRIVRYVLKSLFFVMELLSTRNGKPCLLLDGYQYRLQKKSTLSIRWLCLKEKKENCKGSVKTDFQNNIISKTDHVCVPSEAEVEVKKVMEVCRKRVTEEVSVPVNKIFKEVVSKACEKGYDLVVVTPIYENVKSTLCKERKRTLGTQNPEDSSEMKFKPDDKRAKIDQAGVAGVDFARLFYETLDKKRHLITNLYLDSATAVWNGNGYSGKENVAKLYESLPVSQSEIRSVDAQSIPGDLLHGQTTILVCVAGSVKFTGKNSCVFSESFILTAQPGEKGNVWKIASDCFRFHEPVV